MSTASLERNATPLPNVLKVRGPPRCMSAKTFKKQKATILPRLRERTDPPPRLMRPGTGAANQWHASLRALLERPDAVLVRGYRLYKLSVDLGHWGEPAWLALTHLVVAAVSESGNVVYEDPTELGEEQEYVFVPSERAHRDLTTEELLSNRWLLGSVVGGNPRFCEAFVIHEGAYGRQRGLVAASPEELVAKPNVFVRMMPHFVEWYRLRGLTCGVETQAELMGAPVFDIGEEVSEHDALAAYNAAVCNPEAYTDGVAGLKLELKCRQQLMRGEITIDDVKTLFFAHFDSCARIVRDAQTQRLTERLQASGFNILC
jgi:hypothetical protein